MLTVVKDIIVDEVIVDSVYSLAVVYAIASLQS
jgi:hypothetical protein